MGGHTCSVPITIRLRGFPDQERLDGLSEAIGRTIAARLRQADRFIAGREGWPGWQKTYAPPQIRFSGGGLDPDVQRQVEKAVAAGVSRGLGGGGAGRRSPFLLADFKVPAQNSPTKKDGIVFNIYFDADLTRDQMIDLAENTIFGHRVNLDWSKGQQIYKAKNSPARIFVAAAALRTNLQSYGSSVTKIIKDLDHIPDAQTYQRLTQVLQKLTPAQWDDFEKRITLKTTDLDEFEKSVDAYRAAQQQREAEQEKQDWRVEKLAGMEKLYAAYTLWTVYKEILGRVPPGFEKDFKDKLTADGFNGDVTKFKSVIDGFLEAFRLETVKIGFDILQKYDSLLFKEGERYQNITEVTALHLKLAPLRAAFPVFEKNAKIYNEYVTAKEKNDEYRRRPGNGGLPDLPQERTDAAMAAKAEAERQKAAAVQSVVAISGEFPILKEDQLPLKRRLDKAAMSIADPATLMTLLAAHIKARREDIADTKKAINDDFDTIFALDNLLALSKERQRIDEKSIFGQIIEDKASAIRLKKLVVGVFIAVFAIALGILSGGTGFVAVAAAVGSVTLSSVLAYQAFEEYSQENAEAGTGLLSQEPNPVWLVIAVVGAAFDLAQAAKAIKAISPMAKTLQATGDVAKLAEFSSGLKALEEAGQIDAKIAANVNKAVIARAKSAEAAKDLTQALLSKTYSFPGPFADPDVYKGLVKLAYYKFREVGLSFQEFILEIKQARAAAKLADLTAEDRAVLRKAYDEAVAAGKTGELDPAVVDGWIDELLAKNPVVPTGTQTLAPVTPAVARPPPVFSFKEALDTIDMTRISAEDLSKLKAGWKSYKASGGGRLKTEADYIRFRYGKDNELLPDIVKPLRNLGEPGVVEEIAGRVFEKSVNARLPGSANLKSFPSKYGKFVPDHLPKGSKTIRLDAEGLVTTAADGQPFSAKFVGESKYRIGGVPTNDQTRAFVQMAAASDERKLIYYVAWKDDFPAASTLSKDFSGVAYRLPQEQVNKLVGPSIRDLAKEMNVEIILSSDPLWK